MSTLPSYDELMNPLLAALRQLGGSGSIEEIYAKTVEITGLPEEILAQLHEPEKSSQTEVGYRLAWARTYLKKYGLQEAGDRHGGTNNYDKIAAKHARESLTRRIQK